MFNMKGEIVIMLIFYMNNNFVKSHHLYRRQISPNSSSIIGGYPVSIRQYPYAVSVVSMITDNTSWVCEGSIISTKCVMSAAHCFTSDPPPFKIGVSVGSTVLQQGAHYNTTHYKLHPQYDDNSLDYDISLIIMTAPMVLDGVNSKAVVLATEKTVLVTGSAVTLIGWGRRSKIGTVNSPTLQAVKAKLVNPKVCRSIYTIPDGRVVVTPRMMCIGNLVESGKETCNGDSGGAALDSNGVQIGITSWGVGCARAEYPGLYTNLTDPAIRSWVRSVAGV